MGLTGRPLAVHIRPTGGASSDRGWSAKAEKVEKTKEESQHPADRARYASFVSFAFQIILQGSGRSRVDDTGRGRGSALEMSAALPHMNSRAPQLRQARAGLLKYYLLFLPRVPAS